MKIDKVYIITTNHSEENERDIISRLEKLGLPDGTPYEIFYGINGKHLSDLDVRVFPNWEIESDNEFWSRPITRGEIGCTMSHMGVWYNAYVVHDYETILVLEDDFFTYEPVDWESIDKMKFTNWDIMYLGRIPQTGYDGIGDIRIKGFDDFVYSGYSYQTHAYLINRKGLGKIHFQRDVIQNNIIPADELLSALTTYHPRQDVRRLIISNLIGLSFKQTQIHQFRNEAVGGSTTAPIEGIDYV